MISKKALLVAVLAASVVGVGSTSVLDNFGTISGTAEVEPAIQITEVDYEAASGAEYVELYNPSEGSADLSDWVIEDESGEDTVASLAIPAKSSALLVDDSANTSGLDVNYEEYAAIGHGQLADSGEFVTLSSENDLEIDSVDFSSDPCSADEVRKIDWEAGTQSCEDSSYNFGGGN